MREFVIRQAIANCLNMGYGLQIRSQREMCNSHLQCSLAVYATILDWRSLKDCASLVDQSI